MRDFAEKTELEKKLEAALAQEAELADEESAEAEAAFPTDEQLQQALSEAEALRDQLLRARAEFDNYRRRTAQEKEQLRKTATDQLLRDLLPVIDNLERALSHAEDRSTALGQGVEMVAKQLAGVLQGRGVEPIPGIGELFDPNVHEALAHQPSEEYPADHIVIEYERGYRIGDYILRPAKVVVSSGAPQPAESQTIDTSGQISASGGEE